MAKLRSRVPLPEVEMAEATTESQALGPSSQASRSFVDQDALLPPDVRTACPQNPAQSDCLQEGMATMEDRVGIRKLLM